MGEGVALSLFRFHLSPFPPETPHTQASGERVKLSPLIFFFVNFPPALYYLNAWKKQAIWRFLFIFLTPLTAFYAVLVKRETSAVEARARDSRARGLGPKRNQYGDKSDCVTRL